MIRFVTAYVAILIAISVLGIYAMEGRLPFVDTTNEIILLIAIVGVASSVICGAYLYKKTNNVKWTAAGIIAGINAIFFYFMWKDMKGQWKKGKSFIEP